MPTASGALTPADAPGMRRSASELLAKCDRIRTVIGRLDAQVVVMAYAGLAVDRFRASVAEQRRVMGEVQRILRETAETLNRAAVTAEASGSGRLG